MTLRGFATLIYLADDVAAAVAWYSEFLGVQPFFTRPGPDGRAIYAKFAVGEQQDELAIADRAKARPGTVAGSGGAILHWRVDDLEGTLARLRSMGAEEYQPTTPHGPFVTAVVVDPFGNLVGLQGVTATPHYSDDLACAPAS